eukprot:609916-Pyramimonas_sp.AAC.4
MDDIIWDIISRKENARKGYSCNSCNIHNRIKNAPVPSRTIRSSQWSTLLSEKDCRNPSG